MAEIRNLSGWVLVDGNDGSLVARFEAGDMVGLFFQSEEHAERYILENDDLGKEAGTTLREMKARPARASLTIIYPGD